MAVTRSRYRHFSPQMQRRYTRRYGSKFAPIAKAGPFTGLTGGKSAPLSTAGVDTGSTFSAPATGSANPYDSTYYADIASARHDVQTKEAQLQEQGANDAAARTEALRRISEAQPKQEYAATANANARGLFYSTALGQNLGDIKTANAQKVGDLNTQFDQRERARSAARAALESGLSIQEAAFAAQAADRATQRASDAADAGALAYEGAGASTAAPATSRPSYLPAGYEGWSAAMKSRYWARRRKARGG